MYYGHLLESLKKYDDAVIQYEKAVKMDPTKTDLYKNISSAYEQKNDYKKSNQCLPEIIMHPLIKKNRLRTYSFRLVDFITVLVRNLIH